MKIRTVLGFVGILLIATFGSGCATKVIKVATPAPIHSDSERGYVRIDRIEDLRQFEKSPRNPSTPSIEGDYIENKTLTDKSVGRMRHGLYHRALWNFSFAGDDDIYTVCRRIASSSLTSAGYTVVTEGQEGYSEATPVAVDVRQFWAWMQPKFNLELHFDGELRIHSLAEDRPLDVTGQGSHMLSTGYAGAGAWNEVVRIGVERLNADLVTKLSGLTEQ